MASEDEVRQRFEVVRAWFAERIGRVVSWARVEYGDDRQRLFDSGKIPVLPSTVGDRVIFLHRCGMLYYSDIEVPQSDDKLVIRVTTPIGAVFVDTFSL